MEKQYEKEMGRFKLDYEKLEKDYKQDKNFYNTELIKLNSIISNFNSGIKQILKETHTKTPHVIY